MVSLNSGVGSPDQSRLALIMIQLCRVVACSSSYRALQQLTFRRPIAAENGNLAAPFLSQFVPVAAPAGGV